jgi:hypothetical protein
MHPFLTKLGIMPAVQDFFEPWYTTDENRNLVFSYGTEAEHFGFAFHRVPATGFWQAGDSNRSMIRFVFLCDSAMEAIAYFSLNFHAFRQTEQCLFIAGNPDLELAGRSCSLVFGNDLLGRVRDLKTAAAIRRLPLAISLTGETVRIRFRQKNYTVQQHLFSLNAFEQLSGFRFGVRLSKSKTADSWLEQLKIHHLNH